MLVVACISKADHFGTGTNVFEIEFVTISDPGNPPYSVANPAGSVSYAYRMGKYEISEQMIDKANALGGLAITTDDRGPYKPATSVSWYEAAQFVNWLNTSTGNTPAYKFDASGNFQLWEPTDPGYDPQNLYRNQMAHYFLPSIDEWYKAAYYDSQLGVWYDYPTGSNNIPDGIDFVGDPDFDAVFADGAFNAEPKDIMNVGVLSPYGTAGQGGNVAEWQETAFDRDNDVSNEHRSALGGNWGGIYTALDAFDSGIGFAPQFDDFFFVGFRVASVVPEPNTLLLSGTTLACLCFLGGRVGRDALRIKSVKAIVRQSRGI